MIYYDVSWCEKYKWGRSVTCTEHLDWILTEAATVSWLRVLFSNPNSQWSSYQNLDQNMHLVNWHCYLRLAHRNDAKIAKSLQPQDVLACNSANKPSYQNPTKSLFAQCSVDVKSAVTDAALKISLHFLHLWSVWQKAFLSDFEKMVYWLHYRPQCPEVPDFCYFGIIPRILIGSYEVTLIFTCFL